MSGWTRVAPNAGMGLTESWIFRPGTAPICALRRADDGRWQLDLLHLTGISCSILWVSGELTLEEAKVHGETELTRMGHRWDGAARPVPSGRRREGSAWLRK